MELKRLETDETLRELKTHGDSRFPFQYYLDDFSLYENHWEDWHWHNEVEFASVSSGCADCLIGQQRITLRPGEGIFINSGVIHRFESNENGKMPNILFAPDFLAPRGSLIYEKYVEPVTASPCEYLVLRQAEPWHRELLSMLYQTYAALEQTKMQEYTIFQHVLQLWRILFQNAGIDPTPKEPRGNTLQQARLQLMMQFIHDHFAAKITLEEIANAASVSKSEALHCFHAGIGTTPVAYLIQYRLNRAAGQLLSTTASVSSIAMESGMDNVGYFCRKFRQEYGMTPSEYRKNGVRRQNWKAPSDGTPPIG